MFLNIKSDLFDLSDGSILDEVLFYVNNKEDVNFLLSCLEQRIYSSVLDHDSKMDLINYYHYLEDIIDCVCHMKNKGKIFYFNKIPEIGFRDTVKLKREYCTLKIKSFEDFKKKFWIKEILESCVLGFEDSGLSPQMYEKEILRNIEELENKNNKIRKKVLESILNMRMLPNFKNLKDEYYDNLKEILFLDKMIDNKKHLNSFSIYERNLIYLDALKDLNIIVKKNKINMGKMEINERTGKSMAVKNFLDSKNNSVM